MITPFSNVSPPVPVAAQSTWRHPTPTCRIIAPPDSSTITATYCKPS
ncbi:hypothetical protein CJF30_00011118 [Rutstroemia sp. NJR-2017a BBW]|nr:hypothetical protein CJF30_00011118 [Rutstroemia sp. NJR-2017a BBW]